MWPTNVRKTLVITGHSRNTNQNPVRYHLTPIRMAIIKVRRQQMLERMWRNRKAFTLLEESKLVQPLWKTVWRFLWDLELEIPFDPAILLWDIYPKNYKSFYYKDTCTHVYCSKIHNSKDLEPTQMPIKDRLNKENVAHIHHGILCSH